MLPEWRRLIEAIHQTPLKCVIAVTGGGASAIADLLSVPGGSRTVLEAIVPYSACALTRWLGRAPEQFCSTETARAMGAVACAQAHAFREDPADPGISPPTRRVGLACTASLVSDRPKKGPHRIHIAVETDDSTRSLSLELQKGARDREGEEQLTGRLLLTALARTAGLADLPELGLRPAEAIEERFMPGDPLLQGLRLGHILCVWSLPDGRLVRDLTTEETPPLEIPRGVLCGAFNPLHFGHEGLRAAAEAHLGKPVAFELSLRNVDKPPLDYLTLDERRGQFTSVPLALTSAPTFAEKAVALPEMTFVVGVDTAERIVEPRYYGDRESAMRQALETIARHGGKFLVAGRKMEDRFATLADLKIPAEFASLFEELPASAFRADISSTELRRAASTG